MTDKSEIRRRFMAAIERGLNQAQAEAVANGRAPLPYNADAPAPEPPPELAHRIEQLDDVAELRVRYRIATGKKPFHGWDAAVLREKIAEAASE